MVKRHRIPVTAGLEDTVSPADAALIRRAIRTTLSCEGVTVPCEIDVLLTDEDGIREINREMRGIDAPTDVLSFPAFAYLPGQPPTDGADADPMTGLTPLGDMAINLARVTLQAREYGHSRRRELAYLAVHSVLHLLGYDHLDEGEQKKAMRQREETVMAALALPR